VYKPPAMSATRLTRTAHRLDELIAAGLMPAAAASDGRAAAAAQFAVAVTSAVARLIDPADPADPIARQYLPAAEELQVTAAELADPIGDKAHSPLHGLVHRYPDRVLLMPVEICAVYCRFCFRREVVGPGAKLLDDDALDAAIGYIAAHPGIFEVILTGGDPLMLSPARLSRLMAGLAAIDHVQVIRLHSRIPVASPERITEGLADALKAAGDKAVYVAVHCNHPRELTGEAKAGLRLLSAAGVTLLGQSVLLAGVNDDIETLTALMRGLVAARIKPYYLHQLDLARGTGHFRVPLEKGRALVRALRGRVSGLAQPTYILDIPGGQGKSPITADWLEAAGDGCGWWVEDWQGGRHRYVEPGPDSATD
jgi:lysine 2,3-aminomutase